VQNEPTTKPTLSVQCADSSPKTSLSGDLAQRCHSEPERSEGEESRPGSFPCETPRQGQIPRFARNDTGEKNRKSSEQSQEVAENKGHHFLYRVKRTQNEANFECKLSQFIPKGADRRRLRRPALQKGFAFPGRATTLALRLRLRLKWRGVASPETGWRDWRRHGKAEPFRKAERQSRTSLASKMRKLHTAACESPCPAARSSRGPA
jgi:hypothetical protein